MNTKIHYLYRDADNYKVHNSCVIKGVLTPEQINVILSCCDAGEYFIPNQVGLPERKFEKIDPQVDHCWFELTRDDFEYTDQPANVPVTAQQLTDHFIAAKDSWNDCEFFEQSDQNITDLHNKRYYRERAAMEELPVISRLLEADARSLDRLQVQMATAREFFVLIRFRDDQDADFRTQLSRVQKSLEDQGFKVRLAGKEDAKRMLGVYFEQNATTEKYEDFDGERWIVLND